MNHCLRCSHDWDGIENAKKCPACYSRNWKKPRQKETFMPAKSRARVRTTTISPGYYYSIRLASLRQNKSMAEVLDDSINPAKLKQITEQEYKLQLAEIK